MEWENMPKTLALARAVPVLGYISAISQTEMADC